MGWQKIHKTRPNRFVFEPHGRIRGYPQKIEQVPPRFALWFLTIMPPGYGCLCDSRSWKYAYFVRAFIGSEKERRELRLITKLRKKHGQKNWLKVHTLNFSLFR
jgi:hypothetical protein